MTTQIIGTKKSSDYRRCIRFCRERQISFQERDHREKPLSPTELEKVARDCGGYAALIDEESAVYRKRGLAWMEYDPREELLEDPTLLRVPIVRSDRGAAVVPDETMLRELLL